MPYVGSQFDYDVFVSYAHAEQETDAPLLRNWSNRFATQVRDLLATALNLGSGHGSIEFFLDDRVLVSGQPLTETLRQKVQRSALLLVLMSPLYPHKSWCMDELEWFFAQANRDGRGRQHCIVLRIQPLPADAWPSRLMDERGRPVFFRDLADPDTELPVGINDFEAPALKDAVRQTFIEIKAKLKELRELIEARRAYEQAAAPPEQPVLYLHAQPGDLPVWQSTRLELLSRAIVNPDSLPVPVDDDALLQRQREERLKEYAQCDAVVLLRARADDSFRVEVMAAYNDRRWLFQKRRINIRWAVLDRTNDELPVASVYKVPRVSAVGTDWPDRLVDALGLNPSPTAGGP